MATRILIKDATVLDGCGMPAYAADIRVAGSRIVEVGRTLVADAGERVFDAGGRYLTPEFIETVRSAAARRVCAV